ncbi:MAG: Vms1/Ankzf1 family peptidyl-tRNA hydrolase, partial [Propionicimonas sp.]
MTAASGPARTVSVAPARLAGWLAGFAERHGPLACEPTDDRLTITAADGAVARLRLAWGPLPAGDPLTGVVEAFVRPRRVGALLVRRKAHAVGVFEGDRLVSGRHGSHYVQGRT